MSAFPAARQGHPGARQAVVIEGVAEDGHHRGDPDRGHPGFALGVQWHAEYDPQRNPINGRRSLSSARLVARRRAA
ncbi:MAG TPA: hypothetical protein VK804_10550 [Bradyrhizobium sp.]|jgi:putative glutamine amidotransferase|nr:hypothetical protein [Bradyrhizobium sp.]HTB00904.1 hypothetical protein [Bradyrhizobium sp.]